MYGIWGGRHVGSAGSGRGRYGAVIPVICKRCGKPIKKPRKNRDRAIQVLICKKCLREGK